MKKRVEHAQFVKCPFCGYPVATTNPGQWCAGCLVEYKLGWKWVTFDTERNEFAFARAFQAAGGAKIGNVHDK